MDTVAIIGGGASGMAAAVAASEDPGNRVILFERQQRVGRKLLATGNGRCNLTNTGASPADYHGAAPEFAAPALRKMPPAAVLEFFASLGLVTREEYGGRVYPLSNSANSVADVLRLTLEERSNAELRTACRVESARRDGAGFALSFDGGTLRADYLIVACGGCAGGKLGGVKDGYDILKSLGHRRTGLYPSLTQITTDPAYPRALKGVKTDAVLRLTGAAAGESRGEALFTENGVSGPAAFDLSREVSTAPDGKKELHMDFLPGFTDGQILALLKARREKLPDKPADELFTGVLQNRLGRMAVKYAHIQGTKPLGELSDGELGAAAAACRDFTIAVKGTGDFDSAQVTAGGADTALFDPETMESRLVHRLFACGEVLDVDGNCGGYNLQWAWASGIIAGRLGK